MKRQILQLLTREPILPLFRPFQGAAVTILMLHRFADPDYGNDGHSPSTLRANLDFLRRHGYRLVGLSDLVKQLDESPWPSKPAVVFTVDDGYGDFARVAAPVFAEFDCPVTLFVTTAFVDGGFWMWWDKINWAFAETTRNSLQLRTESIARDYELSSPDARCRAASDLIECVKRVPEGTAQSIIAELLCRAEVELPSRPPDPFLPMSWDDVSRCARLGVTFGPHTVTHPILSRVDDVRARHEIQGSWTQLQRATSSAIPVFCYPNGDQASFGDRERCLLKESGMRASVLAKYGFTTARRARSNNAAEAIELTRYPYADDGAHFRQIVGGIERLRSGVSQISRAWLGSTSGG